MGVAIAAVAAFFYAFVWPAIQNSIKHNTCEAQCPVENGNTDEGCMEKCMQEQTEE